MSDAKRRIAIPWKVRLKYLGVHWLQAPLFLGCLIALVWLWSGQMSAITLVGQVEAVQVKVTSPEAGMLMNLEDHLSPFDRVDKDVTLIARIDVSAALNEMQLLTAERLRLQALFTSESERLRLEQRKLDQDDLQYRRAGVQHDLDRQRNQIGHRDQVDELRRELSDLQQRRRELELKLVEAAAERSAHQQELSGLQRQRPQVEDLVRRNMTPALRLEELEGQIELKQLVIRQSERLDETIQSQIEDLARELTESQSRWDQASLAWQDFLKHSVDPQTSGSSQPDTLLDVEMLLEPLARALAVQDAKVHALAQRMVSNEIRAPVSGMIAQVHQPPGTFVRSGEPIVTIASDQSQWIVAYVGQPHRGVLRPADKIEIRIRGIGSQTAQVGQGTVVSLGVQYELVPEHLRHSPDVIQWGLPVRIAVPDGMTVMPGEMVDLVFTFSKSTRPSM
jgi:multidrug resistance efflux pump